jgi:CRISPR-associated endonuclease Csy4
MDCYIDLRLSPDPEFTAPTLMNALFAKLHRAVSSLDGLQVGVSFPHHQTAPPHLGDCLRIHGGSDDLDRLMSQDWLCAMREYVSVGKMSSAPAEALHCRVRRVQPKSSAPRLRRRYMKRHNVTEEEAARCIPMKVEQRVKLPFLRIKSTSTGQNFRLFIEHSDPLEERVAGRFNSYGLSEQATVPWF